MEYKKGFTLIEILISTAIIAMLALIVGQIYFIIVTQITAYREQTVIVSMADHYMEIARNLPYSQIGTLSGNPHGNLADMVNPINVTVNGVGYQVYYVVKYLDDPADGTIAEGTDIAANDYKQIKLYVKNTNTNFLNSFLTNIVPKGLEGLEGGGALSIKVFDAVGEPVPGATIHIQNATINPAIDLTRISDADGNWIEVGLPNSPNSYHITVTKTGHSSDQTYPVSGQNPDPIKVDSTISDGQVTQISFSIDRTSNLTFNVQNQVCGPLSGAGLNITGSKLIGTPDVLKFDNNYVSNGSGQVVLQNIEWDSYYPQLTGASYMIYGTSPTQQATILPNTNETFNLILGDKTDNALLVIVKNSANPNPIEGADVTLQSDNPSFGDTKITGGSAWIQQEWSFGSGQENFIDPQRYFEDDGNIDSGGVPSGVRLSQFNNVYAQQGTLTSSTFDTGTDETLYTTLIWQPTSQDPSTEIKFQIAANNDSDAATWDFLGPDGTSNSYYTVPGTTIHSSANGKRYLRYKAFLLTQDTAKTPVLTSININYVSGCFTPGQVMFAGLDPGSDYQIAVNASGYQSQTIEDINIQGYN